MNASQRPLRRATLDDLPQLIALWKLEQLPAESFEKRFKEFQVADSDTGEVVAAIGVQPAGTEVRLHSEAFASFEHADELRQRFWDRIRTMGENQGWVRVWTDLSSPVWRQIGFDPADAGQLTRVPDVFGHPVHGTWLVIQLRKEKAGLPSLDAEFERLKLEYQGENQRVLRRARMLKAVGFVLVAGLIGWTAVNAYRYVRNRDRLGGGR